MAALPSVNSGHSRIILTCNALRLNQSLFKTYTGVTPACASAQSPPGPQRLDYRRKLYLKMHRSALNPSRHPIFLPSA
jgi:hypothetical protein